MAWGTCAVCRNLLCQDRAQKPQDMRTRALASVSCIPAFRFSKWRRTNQNLTRHCGRYQAAVLALRIRNLRTTTEFTTTTSVDWEKTGTRTSVSAGKRKLKMQSVGRSTTTTLNVNTNVNCDVRSQQSFSPWRLLKRPKILFFKPCA